MSNKEKIEKLKEQIKQLEKLEKNPIIRTTLYLHSDKESNRDTGQELGLEGMALENFTYALYEVKVEIDLNTATGQYTIVSVKEE